MQIALISALLTVCTLAAPAHSYTARCVMQPDSELSPDEQQVAGLVFLSEDSEDAPLLFDVSLTGFDSTDGEDLHGFHIHETGDVTTCGATGGHYNPEDVKHGAPTAGERHVGDLGNIEEDSDGAVRTELSDDIATLYGEFSVMGRAMVVHALEDDLGLGGDEGSESSGNAGTRLACCVIVDTSTS